jgi:copper(I)-binding protein
MEVAMRRFVVGLTAVALVVAMGAACGGGAEEDAIRVSDAWARSPMQDVGAVYFTVRNGAEVEDRLIGASSPVAGRAEVHETVEREGEMVMQPVEAVPIPPGEEMRFEPGGYHVMLFDLTEPLEVGSTITVVLEFERAGRISIEAIVEPYVLEEGMDGMGDEMGGGMTGATGGM